MFEKLFIFLLFLPCTSYANSSCDYLQGTWDCTIPDGGKRFIVMQKIDGEPPSWKEGQDFNRIPQPEDIGAWDIFKESQDMSEYYPGLVGRVECSIDGNLKIRKNFKDNPMPDNLIEWFQPIENGTIIYTITHEGYEQPPGINKNVCKKMPN